MPFLPLPNALGNALLAEARPPRASARGGERA